MRFFSNFVFFVLLSFLIWIGIVCGECGHPTKTSQWVFDAYKKKEQIAKKIDSKKIVIVAGSNALFGIDSKMLAHAAHLPVLNYGVNAGIELPLTLELAKRVIHRGDIVIAPLEYPMYSYNGKAGVQMIDYILSREPALLKKLTFFEQFYIFWHVSFKRVWQGYFDESHKSVTRGVYGAQHINQDGDQTETEERYRSEAMLQEVLNLPAETYGQKYREDALAMQYLHNFIQWCRQRDVKVIFMPSTLLRKESYFNKAKEQWFYTHIATIIRNKGWHYAGKPYDYMYPSHDYFNTNFHLTAKAREKRTKEMIKDLGF